MLQAPDVRVLRRQLHRLRLADDNADGLFSFAQCRFAWVYLEREDRSQARLHLDDRVALQHVDRKALVLGVAKSRGLLAILALQRHHHVGLVRVAGDDHGQLQLADGQFEPLAADAVREDAECGQDRLAITDPKDGAAVGV